MGTIFLSYKSSPPFPQNHIYRVRKILYTANLYILAGFQSQVRSSTHIMPADTSVLERGNNGKGSGLQGLLMRFIGLDDKYLKLERNIHQEFEKKNKSGDEKNRSFAFQMPLHYPRFSKADYLEMPEWKLDCLLREYGLPICGDIGEKRAYAMATFLWPDKLH